MLNMKMTMPSHKLHCFVDRMCFGRSFLKLHRALDKPYWVLGRKHRVVFHDGWSATEVAKRVCPGDPVALEAAVLHVQLDELCSNNRVFHDDLKRWAELNAQERKRRRGKGKKTKKRAIPSSLKKVGKTCKQLLEIGELARLIRS
jgi:hypothetical protein